MIPANCPHLHRRLYRVPWSGNPGGGAAAGFWVEWRCPECGARLNDPVGSFEVTLMPLWTPPANDDPLFDDESS